MPDVACMCGDRRVIPVADVGNPPLETEVRCHTCGRFWRLIEYQQACKPGHERWTWEAESPPTTDIKATLNKLARRALGVEAALAGLGYTWRARGTC